MPLDTINGTVVLHLPAEGAPIATGQDALDVVGEAWALDAEMVAVPAVRFDPTFFDLTSGRAGEFLQKLVNYQLRLAIIGDITAHVAASEAFRDFVHESNRGRHVWFLAGPEDLAKRLAPAA
jgi:hypothetical protein